jgi:hypothetical protein
MTITTALPADVGSSNPQLVAKSDVRPSELVEAVAVLNMETSPKTPKRPSAAPNQAEDEEEIDSGYASKSSTPESSKFGPFVVNSTPLLSLTRRKKTKLSPYEKEIPKLTRNRFEDLRELYADSLNDLASGIAKRRGILMTLKVLGESEETAEPWVFVQCDKTIAKKVRRFFKQPSVLSDFKPPTSNSFTPKLDVYVHELPLLLLGRNSPLSSTSTHPSPYTLQAIEFFYENQKSLCGSKIVVEVNGQRRSARIGGLISVERAEGSIEHFGITAGHFLNEDCYMEGFDKEAQEELEADEEETDDDADEVFDAEQDFELDLGSSQETASTTLVHERAAELEKLGTISTDIGGVFWTSQKDLQDRPNLDWALFTIEQHMLELPNIVGEHEITETNKEDVQETRPVILSTVSRGQTYGTLSSSWSYLTLPPGKGLVRTKAVKLESNKGWLYPPLKFQVY